MSNQLTNNLDLFQEASNIKIEFKGDLPTNIVQYCDKLKKVAKGIEINWETFTPETKRYFILLAKEYLELKQIRFNGFDGVLMILRLMLMSLKSQRNLLSLYKSSFLIIPKAVNRAIQLGGYYENL